MKKQYVLIYDDGLPYEERTEQEWFDTPSQLHERAMQLLKEGCGGIILSARISEQYQYEPKEVVKEWRLKG